MSQQREKLHSLQVVLATFFLILNIVVPANYASPFWVGVILAEFPLLAMCVAMLPYMHITKLCIGLFATYCATCCYIIGCKFHFQRYGADMTTEYTFIAHCIALSLFFALFMVYTITARWTVPRIETNSLPPTHDAENPMMQFTTHKLFYATIVTAILLALFRASWPTNDAPYQTVYYGDLLTQKSLPYVILPALLSTMILHRQRKVQMWAALGLVIALIATLFYQSLHKEPIWHLRYFTGDPFYLSSLVHTLWLDAGYLATIALVSWLIRMATRPATAIANSTPNEVARQG
jgi:hypothetical protein